MHEIWPDAGRVSVGLMAYVLIASELGNAPWAMFTIESRESNIDSDNKLLQYWQPEPHRCCPLENNVEYVTSADLRHARTCPSMSSKVPLHA